MLLQRRDGMAFAVWMGEGLSTNCWARLPPSLTIRHGGLAVIDPQVRRHATLLPGFIDSVHLASSEFFIGRRYFNVNLISLNSVFANLSLVHGLALAPAKPKAVPAWCTAIR